MAYISTSSVNNAVLHNDISKLNSLIKAGKRIDIQDNLGYKSLHIAAKKLYTGCVQLLLQHPECPINEQCFQGNTSLSLACDSKSPPIKLIQSLLEKGADTNIGNFERIFPLHLACKNGNLEVVKMLIDYNSDVNIQDIDNDTPLHYAVEYNQKLVVQYLLKLNVDTSLANSYGLNPLMLSVVRQYEDIFNLLLPRTKNLYQRAAKDETALSLAIQTGNFNMVQSIINKNSIDSVNSLFVEELYEMNNFEIFKLIWDKQDHKVLYENIQFISVLKLTILKNFEHLKIIFQQPELDLKLGDVFGKMFTGSPKPEFFTDKKNELVFIIEALFKNGATLDKNGFKNVCNFFKNCPYQENIINILLTLTKSEFIITEDLVIFGSSLDAKIGCLCLEYTSNLFSSSKFYNLLSDSDSNILECLNFFIKFHSPNLIETQQMLRNTDKCVQNKLIPFVGKVNSLVELSRNVIRNRIGCCIARKSQHQQVHIVEFRKAIKQLDCPVDTQHILLLKKPVNL